MTLKKKVATAPAATDKPARRSSTKAVATTPASEPATELVVAPAPSPAPAARAAAPRRSYTLGVPQDEADLALELKDFIEVNKLKTQVQGKDFVNVEGWQYAGSRLGILPVVEHVINVSSDTEIKYQAKVTLLHLPTGATVGAGFAICSNKESGRKFYQEFAIASMAQTRAVGKAFRNVLAWMIRAAGYEPTPAEEMEYNGNGNATTAATPAPTPVMQAAPTPAAAPEERPTMWPIRSEAPEDAATAPVQLATAAQKEEIIRLLNHPLITAQEKKKMLENLNRLDTTRATQAIAKLRKAVEDREGTAVATGNEHLLGTGDALARTAEMRDEARN